MTKGLIIIDVQNDYFSDGSLPLVSMDNAAANCKRLLTHYREIKAPVFHIQHVAMREGATFFLPNTHGCEIHQSVMPLSDETVVIKHYPSAFRKTELQELLQAAGIDELVICGAMTHMCIDTTTRAAFDLGYQCQVISDACATRELEFEGRSVSAEDVQAAFLAALRVPFAEVLTTEEFLKKSS